MADVSANSSLQQEAQQVLRALARVQKLFGGDREPATPPRFANPRSMEDTLGRGYFQP